MHHFTYRAARLHAEGVDLRDIVQSVGTPFYCYSAATLRRHYHVFKDAFATQNTLVAFSVKSLSNIAILKLLCNEGAGADVVSGGELRRARHVGIPGERIVFSGVGKTTEEMRLGLEVGIHQFNVESLPELQALNEVAISMNKSAPVAIRVNPDISAGGHHKISTGRAEDKFGISWEQAESIFEIAANLPAIEIKGVDIHIGSQITELTPFRAAFEKTRELVLKLRRMGHNISRLDLGGGLGIPYQHDEDATAPPLPSSYAQLIQATFEGLDLQLIFEPGRMIAGNAGILVSEVLYRKEGKDRKFLILDAAMNDLIRPALYDAAHEIIPLDEPQNSTATAFDIVGPVCETGDTFAKERHLPNIEAGALIAILSAGAYGAVQASEYNTRPLIPEVLVDGDQFAVIRKRPTIDEILERESVPAWL